MRVSVSAVALFFVASCSIDTQLPQKPARGRVVGSLDTQNHLAKAGNSVALVSLAGDRLTQTTDDNAAFTFGDVAPGNYQIVVALPGFSRYVTEAFRVKSAETYDLGVLKPEWNVAQAGSVFGKVRNAKGVDVADARVEFFFASRLDVPIASTTSSLTGEFVLSLNPGNYRIKVSHPLYIRREVEDVMVTENSAIDLSLTPVVLELNPAKVTGSILKEVDGAAPVAAVDVSVVVDPDGDTTKSDALGNFALGGLPGGDKQIRLQLLHWHDSVPSRPVTLFPGKTSELVADGGTVLLLVDRGNITGTVRMADGTPAEGATVSVTGTGYGAAVSVDSSDPSKGTFIISGVPLAPTTNYEVRATKPKYSQSAANVVLRANEAVNAGDLTLTLLQGDFVIDDGDNSNTPGYTRTVDVQLKFTGFPQTATAFRTSEDPTFANAAFQPYPPADAGFRLVDTEGNHTIYAQYRDTNGTPSQTLSSSVIVDKTVPSSVAVDISATGINGTQKFTRFAQTLNLTVTGVDVAADGVTKGSGVSKMLVAGSSTLDTSGKLQVPSSTYLLNPSFTRTTTAEGSQSVYVQLIDNAGNVSAVMSDNVIIDTTAPVAGISIQKGLLATANGFTNDVKVFLDASYTPEANGGALKIKLANTSSDLASATLQPVSATTAWFLDPLGEGQKTVYASFVDTAGNTSSPVPASIVYDITPPTPATVSLVSAANSSSLAVTLNINSADMNGLSPTAAVTVSGNAAFSGTPLVAPQAFPMSAQVSFSMPMSTADGSQPLFVRYQDVAGNTSIAATHFILDRVPPSGAFTLRGTLADGSNSSTISSVPSLTVLLTQAGATDYALGSEALTNCNGASYTPLNNASSLPFLMTGADGAREVHLCLKDGAGNFTGPLIQPITLKTTGPSGCAMTLAGSRADNNGAPPAGKTASPFITATVTCANSPVEVFLTTTATSCSAAASFPYVALPASGSTTVVLPAVDATYGVQGCVRDVARAVATVAAVSMTLDTTPPVGAVVTIDNGVDYINAATVTSRGGNIGMVNGSASGATEWAISESSAAPANGAYVSVATNPRNFTFAGTGLRTIYASFRDDVGNVSPAANDSITIDATAPIGGTLALNSYAVGVKAYTSSVSLTLNITKPADAVSMQVAKAPTLNNCGTITWGNVSIQAAATAATFLLDSVEQEKTICVQLLDAAGNVSTPISANVVLDVTPPSVPTMSTRSAILNVADGSVFTVTTLSGVTETNFSRYEKLGGSLTSWTADSVVKNTTSFNFNLVTRPTAETGFDNVLKLRAVDLAGNVSDVAQVIITTDNNLPDVVGMNTLWVSNGDRQSTVYWTASASLDVIGYNVYYASTPQTGLASKNYNGNYSSLGKSPVFVSGRLNTSLTLTGLSNGSATYVSVRPVDHAEDPVSHVHNEGPYPSAPDEAFMQPDEVSPDTVADIAIGMTRVSKIETFGSWAYLAGTSGGCGTATAMLQPVDLTQIVSPVQGGVPIANPAGPVAGATLSYADNLDCTSINYMGVDLAIDGQYAFLASGTKVRIFSLANPGVPLLLTTLDLTPNILSGVQARGPYLIVGGRTNNTVIDLTKLYDNNQATTVGVGDVIGNSATSFTGGSPPASGITWTRDSLLQLSGSNPVRSYSLVDAFDGAAGTPWDNSDYLGTGAMTTTFQSDHIASGNYLYASTFFSFTVTPLGSLWAGTPLDWQNSAFTPLASTILSGGYQLELSGGRVFVSDTSRGGVVTYDLTDVTNTYAAGFTKPAGTGTVTSVTGYGNYLLVGTIGSRLKVLEVVTPRALSLKASTPNGAPRAELNGAFILSGPSVDLQGGFPPRVVSPTGGLPLPTICLYDTARFEDTVVQALGASMRVVNYEDAIDRNAATDFTSADLYDITLPMGTTVTGIDAYGNYLVAVEQRNTGVPATSGTYLEVFTASAMRDRRSSTSLALSDSRGSFLVTTSTGVADVSVYQGRAFVGLDGPSGGGTYIVDIRDVIDDNNTTSTFVALGNVPGAAPAGSHEVVVRGNYAYVGANAGLEILDVSAAFTGGTVPVNARVSLLSSNPVFGVQVFGSHAFLSGVGSGAGARVVDVSNPLAPKSTSFAPLSAVGGTCGPVGSSIALRSSILVRGTQAYFSAFANTYILDLE